MLRRASGYAFTLLGLGLPLHGGITVFLPDVFRWWKELVLLALMLILLILLCRNWRLFLKNVHLKSPLVWGLAFLVWGSALTILNSDLVTAATAWRYISLGFIVFVCISSLMMIFSGQKVEKTTLEPTAITPYFFHKFYTGLLAGSFFSVIFGAWAQFGNGFESLKLWYSQTISSWVPGQTIPMYHQTSEGIVRMQGLSSGPIEFSHILVLALFCTLWDWFSNSVRPWWQHLLYLVLGGTWLVGIWFSGSRAALAATMVMLVGALFIWLHQSLKTTNSQLKMFSSHWEVNVLLVLILSVSVLGGVKYVVTELPASALSKVVRLSDSDHITRPIEAFQIGMTKPLSGNLGQLGPAARAKNLKLKNSDQAPIAENVFIDYFAQLGILGLLLALVFFGVWLYRVWQKKLPLFVLLGICLFGLMNLATIFDMTPISIAWFAVLAFGAMLPTEQSSKL